jgi:hypothetical protein
MATVTFRFMSRDWNNTLRDLLDRHNIPVIGEKKLALEKNTLWHN